MAWPSESRVATAALARLLAAPNDGSQGPGAGASSFKGPDSRFRFPGLGARNPGYRLELSPKRQALGPGSSQRRCACASASASASARPEAWRCRLALALAPPAGCWRRWRWRWRCALLAPRAPYGKR
jgi:hypothetical protein